MSTKKEQKITGDCGCADNSKHTDAIVGPETGIWTGDKVPTADVGLPGSWGVVTKNIGTVLSFSNQFNTYLSADTGSGWNLGYLNEANIPYSTDISTLDCTNVPANIIAVPSNSIGNDRPTATPPEVGYYKYTPPGYLLEIFRILVFYKVCDGKLTIYIVKVTDLQSIPHSGGTEWTSEVDFEHKCISDCNIPGHLLEHSAELKAVLENAKRKHNQ